jgi:hypothetical protein
MCHEIKAMRRAVHVARMREMRYAYQILVVKPEGNKALGRPGHRREDNIKINL